MGRSHLQVFNIIHRFVLKNPDFLESPHNLSPILRVPSYERLAVFGGNFPPISPLSKNNRPTRPSVAEKPLTFAAPFC